MYIKTKIITERGILIAQFSIEKHKNELVKND